MSDLINRQAAITLPVLPKEYREYQTSNLDDAYEQGWNDLQKCIESLPSAQQWISPRRCIDCENFNKTQLLVPQSKQKRWIPVKWKPLNDREREEWEDFMGYKLADEEAVEPDCKMPDDGDEIWICTKSGQVSEDIFCNDYGLLSLEDEDIMDIVAWMPRTAPEPYKESENG